MQGSQTCTFANRTTHTFGGILRSFDQLRWLSPSAAACMPLITLPRIPQRRSVCALSHSVPELLGVTSEREPFMPSPVLCQMQHH